MTAFEKRRYFISYPPPQGSRSVGGLSRGTPTLSSGAVIFGLGPQSARSSQVREGAFPSRIPSPQKQEKSFTACEFRSKETRPLPGEFRRGAELCVWSRRESDGGSLFPELQRGYRLRVCGQRETGPAPPLSLRHRNVRPHTRTTRPSHSNRTG